MSRALKLYIAGVVAAAAASVAMLPTSGIGEGAGAAIVLGALAAVAGARSVRIARLRVEVTPGDAFIFCSLIAVAPLAAPLVGMITTIGAAVAARRLLSLRTVFNVGAVTLSAAASAWCFVLLRGTAIGGGERPVVSMLGAAGVFFLVNTLLVAVAIRLEKRGSFFAICRQSGLWTAASTMASVLLAAGLLSFFDAMGPLGLLFGMAGVAVLAGSYRAYRARIELGSQAASNVLRDLDAGIEANRESTPSRIEEAPAPVVGSDPSHDRDPAARPHS